MLCDSQHCPALYVIFNAQRRFNGAAVSANFNWHREALNPKAKRRISGDCALANFELAPRSLFIFNAQRRFNGAAVSANF